MSQHIFSGSGAPGSTPSAIGQHYVDTLNGRHYLSVGTSSSADWKVVESAADVPAIAKAAAVADAISDGVTDVAPSQNAVFDALALKAAASPVYRELFINTNRAAELYTADGSFDRPFKTVVAAKNQVIANADNSANNPYMLSIMGPADIDENLILENAALINIFIRGIGPFGSVGFSPASGDALRSIANNDTLDTLILENLYFNGPVELIGASNGSAFLRANGHAYNCRFVGALTLKNLGDFEIDGGKVESSITIENIVAAFLYSGEGILGDISMVDNGAANKPDGYTGSILVADNVVATGNMTIGAGTRLQPRGGARMGSPGGTITVDGTYQAYPSFTRANIVVNSGGNLTLRGGLYKDSTLTVNAGGTVAQDVALGQFASFVSAVQTGNGSAQSVPHGLGYTPTKVLISIQDNNAAAFVITEGVHTSTNVVVTVTSGAKYKVMAF